MGKASDQSFPSASDIVRVIGRAIVGAPKDLTKDDYKSMSRAQRKGQGSAETLRADREMRAGMSVCGFLFVLIVAAFILQASGGTEAALKQAQRIDTLHTSDQVGIRTALFGAAPTVLECKTPHTSGASRLREMAVAHLVPDGLRVATIECDQPITADGASLLQRFQLEAPAPTAPPLLLQTGHGLRSPLVIGKHGSAASLARFLKRWAQAQVPRLNSTLDLHRLCLSRPVCLVLLTTGTASSSAKKAVVSAVGSSQRNLGLTTIDRKVHTASFASQIPSTTRPVLVALRSKAQSADGVGSTAASISAEVRPIPKQPHSHSSSSMRAHSHGRVVSHMPTYQARGGAPVLPFPSIPFHSHAGAGLPWRGLLRQPGRPRRLRRHECARRRGERLHPAGGSSPARPSRDADNLQRWLTWRGLAIGRTVRPSPELQAVCSGDDALRGRLPHRMADEV